MSHSLKRPFASAPVRSPLAAAAIVFVASAVTCPLVFSQTSVQAKTTEDLPAGPMAAKATNSCLECHKARIILQQRLNKVTWTKEVDKMTRWGAVVDSSDHDALIEY